MIVRDDEFKKQYFLKNITFTPKDHSAGGRLEIRAIEITKG